MDAATLEKEANELLNQAKAALDKGETEQFDKMFDEAKAKDAVAVKQREREVGLKALEAKYGDPADADRTDHRDADKKDADDQRDPLAVKGYNRALPLVAQSKGVIELLPKAHQVKVADYNVLFEQYVRKGKEGMSAKERKAMQEGTDNEGGFMVPDDFLPQVARDPGVRGSQLRPLSTVFQTNRALFTVPTAAAVDVAYVAEEGVISGADQTPTIGEVTIDVFKCMGLTKVSSELLEDSAVNLGALLGTLFAEAFGRDEDEQIIGGDGTGEAKGLITEGLTDYVMDGDDVLIIGDILGIYYAVPQQYRDRSTWQLPSLVEKTIALLNTGAGGMYLWIPGLAAGQPPTILGRPVVNPDVTGWATTLEANAEIGCLGDMSNYYIVDRTGTSLKRLDEAYAANDQVGFVWRKRWGGEVAVANAFRVLKCKAT